jgi:hypothetical protein
MSLFCFLIEYNIGYSFLYSYLLLFSFVLFTIDVFFKHIIKSTEFIELSQVNDSCFIFFLFF